MNSPTYPHDPSARQPGLVILNPAAGNGRSEHVKKALARAFGEEEAYVIHETTEEEKPSAVVRAALADKAYAWVAAAGGDGTVTEVADGLARSEAPLGIIPVGTANGLAQALHIPRDIGEACDLLAGKHTLRRVDAVQVGDRYFLLRLDLGLESLTMEKTPGASKEKFGPLAYLWTAAREMGGWQPHHFSLTVDGQEHPIEASELVVANAATLGVLNLDWGEEVRMDDGRIDIAVVKARSLADYARLLATLALRRPRRNAHIQFYSAHESLRLDGPQKLPLHGDGEVLEEWPVEARVVPGALRVVVPREAS